MLEFNRDDPLPPGRILYEANEAGFGFVSFSCCQYCDAFHGGLTENTGHENERHKTAEYHRSI